MAICRWLKVTGYGKPRNDGSVGVVLAENADDLPPFSTWPEGTDLMAELLSPGVS